MKKMNAAKVEKIYNIQQKFICVTQYQQQVVYQFLRSMLFYTGNDKKSILYYFDDDQ